MSPTSLLITGGNGNLGRLVAQRFILRGLRVISFDLPGTKPVEGVHATVHGDMRQTEVLRNLLDDHKPEAIIHLASLLSGSSEADPQAAWAINATASVTLMRLAEERRIGPFVFASTIATYGGNLPKTLPEDAPQWPDNVYGATKVAVERMGVWLKQSARFDFRCLRFPMVLSPRAPKGAVTAYPSHAFNAAATGQPFTFPVSKDTGMSTLFLDDVVASLVDITLAPRDGLGANAYNLHGFHVTAGEIAARIKAEIPAFRYDFAPDPRVDALIKGWPDHLVDESARKDWGWQPAYDFEACAKEMFRLAAAEST